MPQCECVPKCPFFNDRMKGLNFVKEQLKKKFCLGDKTGCARYMVFSRLGRDAVPGDLAPNQPERARELLGE